MKGKTVYLRENERKLITQAIRCYIETMEDGEDTKKIIKNELENGLKTGYYKLCGKD